MNIADMLLNIYVLSYLLLIILFVIFLPLLRQLGTKYNSCNRKKQNLSSEILVGPEIQLKMFRLSSLIESSFLMFLIIFIPFIFLIFPGIEAAAKKGLVATFIALFIWITFSASDMLKAMIGGFFFRILVATNRPFQMHDRVTIKGESGKIVEIGIFHVRLQTPNDDLISIPTYSLWSETLTSANAGDRSSLCVINFYISPSTNHKKRKKAEDLIWDAIQASIYYDPGKPMQIYCSQTPDSVILTAKAYVANTYKEPDFKSDVTNQALDGFCNNGISLTPSILQIKAPMANDYSK